MLKPCCFAKNAILFIVLPLLYFACSPEISTVDTKYTAGNIVGRICDENGKAAAGVSVQLAPANYNAYAHGNGSSVDSTTTNADGSFGFRLEAAGFYNVIARQLDKYSFEDSVYGSEKGRIEIKTDTLKAPGSISGIAQLQPGYDNRHIIILVQGTNTYATAIDSSGAFSIPALAEGNYMIRILTTENGYGFFDSTVSVTSGGNTEIPGIVHLSFGIPDVGPVKASYDSHTMHVTLSWPACDKSNIDSFYIFRNTGIAEKPYAVVNNNSTSFEDDVMLLNPNSQRYHDTLRYSVAACGRDRTIGRVGIAPDILLRSILTPVDTVSLSAAGCNFVSPWCLFSIDKNRNIYVCDSGWIKKIDSTGRVSSKNNAHHFAGDPLIKTDENGNVYVRYDTLFKLSADLKDVAKRAVDFDRVCVDPNGQVYVCEAGTTQERTKITVLDSTFSQVNSSIEYSYDESLQYVLNGTLVFLNDRSNTTSDLKYYTTNDLNFNQKRTWNVGVLIKDEISDLPEQVQIRQICMARNSMFIVNLAYQPEGAIPSTRFFVIDTNGRLFAQFAVPRSIFYVNYYAFDGTDQLCFYNYLTHSMYIYKINW